jgi:hypothetical protein
MYFINKIRQKNERNLWNKPYKKQMIKVYLKNAKETEPFLGFSPGRFRGLPQGKKLI